MDENLVPELKDWEKIHNQADNNYPSATTKALERATVGIVNARLSIGGLAGSVDSLKRELEKLNTSIKSFNDTSARFAKIGVILSLLLVLATLASAIASIITITKK